MQRILFRNGGVPADRKNPGYRTARDFASVENTSNSHESTFIAADGQQICSLVAPALTGSQHYLGQRFQGQTN
jgi:hypothetical protein